MGNDTAITTYGEKNAAAPAQLDVFAFLVGKWSGGGRTRLPDGTHAEFDGVTWIGRYILDGMAIADEGHAKGPDGQPHLGISLRYFDAQRASWIIEFLNVTNSFIRRQVNPRSGSVSVDDGSVVITGEDGQTKCREIYRPIDQSHFNYSLDMSRDGGQSWDVALIEMKLARIE